MPLDYDQPYGATISLNLSKRPANQQANKLGSLFFNPGGPGGPAAPITGYVARALGQPVLDRFDVIGIDPRGIGGSAPVHCIAEQGDPPRVPWPNVAFPRGPHQISQWQAADESVRALCALRGNAILDHMSTADNARDMDLIRQAVGDEALTYYGASYGTLLGSTYAAMFPDRVRAIVLDGVVDPVQQTFGRFGLGLRYVVLARAMSGYGSWEALTSSFNECDRVGPRVCRYAGRITGEWDQVIAKLRQGAVRVGRERVTYASVYGNLIGALYSPSNYPSILGFIDALYQQIFDAGAGVRAATAKAWTALRATASRSTGTRPSFVRPPRSRSLTEADSSASILGSRYDPTFEGVICADSLNPTDAQTAIASARFANRWRGPGFGALWSWYTSDCVKWPGSSADAFRGPWRHRTLHPLLITGNLHDPATPISGARAANKLFPGSVLMTVNVWGHAAVYNSQCALRHWDTYFVTGKLPAPGLVCRADAPLFGG